MSVKRNDPCICGSGKKYKKCCLQSPAGSLSGKDLSKCLSTVSPVLERHVSQRFGDAAVTAAWYHFGRYGQSAIAHEKQLYQAAFSAWWLFSWLPEDQSTETEQFASPAPDHAFAADYLKLHRTTLTPLVQRMIERALKSPYSFYVVNSVEPGNQLQLQEIYTQKRVTVEADAAADYSVGDVLFSAVLSVDGVSMLLGCMPKILGPRAQLRIETHREKWQLEVNSAIDQRLLYLHDTELRRYYFLLLSQQQQAILH